MLAVINDIIYNLDKWDILEKRDKNHTYSYRIACIRDGEEVEYIPFESYEELDKEWNKLVSNSKAVVHTFNYNSIFF